MRKVCEACGEVFYTLSPQQKYCFDCKVDSGKSVRRQKEKLPVCPVCGDTVYFPRLIYCSDECKEIQRKRRYQKNRKKRINRYLEQGEEKRKYQREYYRKNCERINERARQKRKEIKEAQQNEEGY